MSIQPQPIYGNQYFTEVQNVASTNFQRIHADQLVTSHLQVGVDTKVAGDLKQYTVKLLSPAAAAAGTFALTKVDGTAFTLPANALVTQILECVLTAPTLGGTATINNSVGILSASIASNASANTEYFVPIVAHASASSASALNLVLGTSATVAAGGIVVYVTYTVPFSA